MTTTPALTGPRLGRYLIDPDGSSVDFATRHLFGLGRVRGSFAIHRGHVDVAEPLSASAVTAEIDAASCRSGNPARDTTVRSPKLLDAERHPFLVFVADQVSETELVGTLTVRGVAQPVRLAVTGSTVSADGTGFQVRATARVDRTAFGVTALRGLAGRQLDLTIEVVCVRTR